MAAVTYLLIMMSPWMVWTASAQTCPQPPTGLDISAKLQQAEILLFGRDITPPLSDCLEDPGNCFYRRVLLEVHCIIKNSRDAPIGSHVTIGTDPPGPCDGTYFAYDETGDMIVAMVTYDVTSEQFDWDEVVPGESAKFLYNPGLEAILAEELCGVGDWNVPDGAGTTCPAPLGTTCTGGTICPESSLNLNISSKLSMADIVLYGQDVTQQPDCLGDVGSCYYRQITFNVMCVIKNDVNATIAPTIVIGMEPLSICDGTYFAHGETGEILVVMVTYDAVTRTYDWNEVQPATSAKFLYTDDLEGILWEEYCAAGVWKVPDGAADGTSCPAMPSTSCPEMMPPVSMTTMNVYAILGLVFGGLLLIALCIVCAIFSLGKGKKSRSGSDSGDDDDEDSSDASTVYVSKGEGKDESSFIEKPKATNNNNTEPANDHSRNGIISGLPDQGEVAEPSSPPPDERPPDERREDFKEEKRTSKTEERDSDDGREDVKEARNSGIEEKDKDEHDDRRHSKMKDDEEGHEEGVGRRHDERRDDEEGHEEGVGRRHDERRDDEEKHEEDVGRRHDERRDDEEGHEEDVGRRHDEMRDDEEGYVEDVGRRHDERRDDEEGHVEDVGRRHDERRDDEEGYVEDVGEGKGME